MGGIYVLDQKKVWIFLKDRKITVQRLEGGRETERDVDENGSDIVKINKCCYRVAWVKRDSSGRVFKYLTLVKVAISQC